MKDGSSSLVSMWTVKHIRLVEKSWKGSTVYRRCTYTNQTRAYFWIKDGKKAVHVDLFTDKLGLIKEKKKLETCWDTDTTDKSLHSKGVVPPWTFGPRWGTQSDRKWGSHHGRFSVWSWWSYKTISVVWKPYYGMQDFSEPIRWERDDLLWTIIKPPHPHLSLPSSSISTHTLA